MAENRMPAVVFERAPCPGCGATTLAEAQTQCRPTSDETGEYDCPGGDGDAEGFITQPTADSLQRIDDWIDAQVETERKADAFRD